MKNINILLLSLVLTFPLFAQEGSRIKEALQEPLIHPSHPYFDALDQELAKGFHILVQQFLNQRFPQ